MFIGFSGAKPGRYLNKYFPRKTYPPHSVHWGQKKKKIEIFSKKKKKKTPPPPPPEGGGGGGGNRVEYTALKKFLLNLVVLFFCVSNLAIQNWFIVVSLHIVL